VANEGKKKLREIICPRMGGWGKEVLSWVLLRNQKELSRKEKNLSV